MARSHFDAAWDNHRSFIGLVKATSNHCYFHRLRRILQQSHQYFILLSDLVLLTIGFEQQIFDVVRLALALTQFHLLLVLRAESHRLLECSL